MKLMFVTATLLTAAISWHLINDDFARSGVLASRGAIDSGQRFGIQIGEPISDATSHLEAKGIERVDIGDRKRCHSHSNPNATDVRLFRDDSWRSGTICVFADESGVIRISWWYNWAAP